jgi:hypothetical protein
MLHNPKVPFAFHHPQWSQKSKLRVASPPQGANSLCHSNLENAYSTGREHRIVIKKLMPRQGDAKVLH